jgi:hypothetical protein
MRDIDLLHRTSIPPLEHAVGNPPKRHASVTPIETVRKERPSVCPVMGLVGTVKRINDDKPPSLHEHT